MSYFLVFSDESLRGQIFIRYILKLHFHALPFLSIMKIRPLSRSFLQQGFPGFPDNCLDWEFLSRFYCNFPMAHIDSLNTRDKVDLNSLKR